MYQNIIIVTIEKGEGGMEWGGCIKGNAMNGQCMISYLSVMISYLSDSSNKNTIPFVIILLCFH